MTVRPSSPRSMPAPFGGHALSLLGRARPRKAGSRLALTGPRSPPGTGRYTLVVSDNELGVYLRTRREAVTPAEVGLPGGGRRRTPGLRRAELATLAGVSVEYLVRLEQGRDRHPSAHVLAALADVLGLSADERLHLHLLAKATGGVVSSSARRPRRLLARCAPPCRRCWTGSSPPRRSWSTGWATCSPSRPASRGLSALSACSMANRPALSGSCSPMLGLGPPTRTGAASPTSRPPTSSSSPPAPTRMSLSSSTS